MVHGRKIKDEKLLGPNLFITRYAKNVFFNRVGVMIWRIIVRQTGYITIDGLISI